MLTNRIEEIILYNLLHNEVYNKRVIAFLKEEMFFESSDKIIFQKISKHTHQYKSPPTPEAILIACDKDSAINERQYESIVDIISRISNTTQTDYQMEWLVDETEKFCQEKAIIRAILDASDIINNDKTKKDIGEIPEIIKNALAISFDPHIGHSYFEDAEGAHEHYNRKEHHIPCDLDMFNKLTKGGVTPKTLNILMAGTNVGKSFFLCHLAASYLSQGHDVLYITLEMDEYGIRERIDANLMNLPIDDIPKMPKAMFMDRVKKLRAKHSGELIIKEYPTTGANINHFRALMQEIHLKKNFQPKIILIDYLNIVSSSRFKSNTRSDMYTYIKSVAEELRSLAQEFNVPVWTATQTNRDGFKTDDPGLENSSESFGTAMTGDLILALIRTEELDTMGKIRVKVLKNRSNNTSNFRRFNLGLDLSRMKVFDDLNTNSNPTPTQSSIGSNEISLEEDTEKPKATTAKREDYSSKFKNSFVYDQMLSNSEDE